MRFWKASSLGPHYVVSQQNLGIKTCLDFFSVIRGHLTQGIHFLYAIYKAFQKTELWSDFTRIRPMLSAAACGPFLILVKPAGLGFYPTPKPQCSFAPSFHLANLHCYPEYIPFQKMLHFCSLKKKKKKIF
jgi:hypothetical protein